MAADGAAKRAELNPCCKEWKEKRDALRQGVNIYKTQFSTVKAQYDDLNKAYEEELARVDFEKEGRLKESAARVSLENEVRALKSEISSLQQKAGANTQDRIQEVKLLQARVSGAEKEINQLKELLEKEKKRADFERQKAEVEKKKAAEALKSVKVEKSKADEEKRVGKIEREKAEQYRLELEMLNKKVDEANSKLAAETLKFEQESKRYEAEKQKAIKERERADSEMAKAEEQRKLAEANGKKVVEEKCRAENLSQQLEENRHRIEKFQKEMHELVSSRILGLSPADNESNPESAKMNDRLQAEILNREVDESMMVSEHFKTKKSKKKLDVEKGKAIREKKRAYSDMVKAEEQKKVAEVNCKKAMEEKCSADQLSQQLQEDRRTIDELQKKIHELQSTRKADEGSAVSPDNGVDSENMKVKHLKKQLKFEKMQAKHAKQVAKFEKGRNSFLQQELGRFKLEFVQFSHRLDILDKSFSLNAEGIDGQEKTGHIAYMPRLNMKDKLCSSESCWAHPQNELLKSSSTEVDTSDPFRQTLQCTAPFLPISGGNYADSIPGIDSKLESLLGGSNQKMLQSCAINSSTASFSDGQLMGSQERGSFSVITSAKLAEENLNAHPTISSLSGEVTKMRCNENFAVVAENNVSAISIDDVGRVCDHTRKRKRILDVESIEYLYSEGKKLHLQMEEKLSVMHGMLNRQVDQPLDEGRYLVPNLQGNSSTKYDQFHKKRKLSHKEEVLMQHFCERDEQKQTEKVETEVSEDANDLEALLSFEEVADGDYMKLLELNNAADEECYRIAMEMPLSPTLPEIKFQSIGTVDVDNSEALVEDWVHEGLSNEKENLLPSHSFDVIDVEINFNKLKSNFSVTSHNSLLHKNVVPDEYFDVNGSGISNASQDRKTCPQHIWDSDVVVGMSNVFRDEVVKFPLESELGSADDVIPKYCVVFFDIKDRSIISRIFCATKTCIGRCSLVSQTEWVVPEILLAVKMEENLLPKERVCVFFSLLLLNLSTAAPRKFGNSSNRDFILCLDSFSGHIRAVMSDVETRSVFAEFGFLDELLSLIEDFLIDGRFLVYNYESSEKSIKCDSRIDFVLDGLNIGLSYEVASAKQVVAGSIILASICAAIDHIGFICEASYNIFRRRVGDSSLVLTILHVFAYLVGEKFFGLSNYSLPMTVLKSMVMLLEGVNLSVTAVPSVSGVQTQFHPCAKCPFSDGAVSVDTVTSLLLELLLNHDVIESFNPLNSRVLLDKYKFEQNSSHEEVHHAVDDASCFLDKYKMPTSLSDSVVNMTLCYLSDVLSLVELVACNMSWDWISVKVVPQLLKMLESCVSENFAAAIVVLIGQLGRLGVDAGGYEDNGVENLRCNLSDFLCRDATIKAGLPIQIATVTALLELLPLDFEALIKSNLELQAVACQPVPADIIRKWFFSLSKEQQDLSIGLLQTAAVKNKLGLR